jgi:hypothetical protein
LNHPLEKVNHVVKFKRITDEGFHEEDRKYFRKKYRSMVILKKQFTK